MTLGAGRLQVRHPRRVRGLQAKLRSQNKLLIDAITLCHQSMTPFTVSTVSLGSWNAPREGFRASAAVPRVLSR